MKPDRKLVRDTLKQWAAWSRNYEKCGGEKGYPSISPPWELVIPIGRGIKVNHDDAAEMVEAVFREMAKWKPKARALLRYYYLRDELLKEPYDHHYGKDGLPTWCDERETMSEDEFIKWLGLRKTQFYELLGAAQDTYASIWKDLFWDDYEERADEDEFWRKREEEKPE